MRWYSPCRTHGIVLSQFAFERPCYDPNLDVHPFFRLERQVQTSRGDFLNGPRPQSVGGKEQ